MKTILFVVLIGVLPILSIAQSVTVTGPDEAEIGIASNYTATFSAGGVSGITILSYQWGVPFNGDGISGISGIQGSTGGQTTSTDPFVVTSNATSNSVDVIWGDFYEVTPDNVNVSVFYRINGGAVQSVNGTKSVKILTISVPSISAPSTVQKCCTESIEVCDLSEGNQDDWDWTVSGGTLISGDGTDCITIVPNKEDNIVIDVTAFRVNGHPSYDRSNTRTITRTTPHTPAITGPNFACKGTNITLCTDDICGLDATQWTGTSTLSLYNGQGNLCADFTPNSSVTNGTTTTISALSILIGGCTASSSTHDVTIYDTGTPPTPSGTVWIEFEEGYDPCSDAETSYIIHYTGTYPNGIITVTPTLIVDVPHHHVNDQFDVVVCYRNLCGGGTSCRTYHMYLPAPCKDDPFQNPIPRDTVVKDLNNSELSTRSSSAVGVKANIYPNPAMNNLQIEHMVIGSKIVEVYTIDGRILLKTSCIVESNLNLDLSKINQEGIYFLRIISPNKEEVYKFNVKK